MITIMFRENIGLNMEEMGLAAKNDNMRDSGSIEKIEKQAPKQAGISLERNKPYECNIIYNPDHFYRAMDEVAYDDFIKTGRMVGAKAGRGAVYFQKGFANNRYVNNGRIKPIIVETDNRANFSIEESSGYASVSEISKEAVEKGDMPLRIWLHKGGNHWEIIFDNFKDKS